MYGNLLCVSPSGTFRDNIWVTVAGRDPELLQREQTVFVALCTDVNTLSDAQAVLVLSRAAGRAVMVESPTYYLSYRPALRALQALDVQNLPFLSSLVSARRVIPEPAFLRGGEDTADPDEVVSLDPRAVYENAPERVTVDEFLDLHGATTLDLSQQAAVKKALRCQVAVIQGPPGTGKTFLGVKLVELLLNMSSNEDATILVLTYKNHALDEFMKELARLYPREIARVGGRSLEPTLASRSLKELRRHTDISMELDIDLSNVRSALETLEPMVKAAAGKLTTARSFSLQCLVDSSTSEELQSLLLGADWARSGLQALLIPSTNCEHHVSSRTVRWLLAQQGDLQEELQYQGLDCAALQALLQAALLQWCPPRDTFLALRDEIQQRVRRVVTKRRDATHAAQLEELEEEEEDVEAAQQERMPGGGNRAAYNKEDLVLFGQDDVMDAEGWPVLLSAADDVMKHLADGFMRDFAGDLWSLGRAERARLIQYYIWRRARESEAGFAELTQKYQDLCAHRRELEGLRDVEILRRQRVVGMTITGASIHVGLLQRVRPKIVLVEEAAEVLEPQLLVTLGSWVQQLILIGDHKQLRPPVQSHDLKRKFHLDVSMMERLINNGLPYATLQCQNRMRPEFAELLKDIYPKLQSNLQRVSLHTPLDCMGASMWFWDHDSPEKGGRSYSNAEEAERAVTLTLFLLQHGGCRPGQITVLAAYLGQALLIRRLLRERLPQARPAPPQQARRAEDQPQPERVDVQTIDNYQGDENDYVIVSTVRCNDRGVLGFLRELNRRCVSQSRARRGMYFIGSVATLKRSPHWCRMIQGMAAYSAECVSRSLALRCPEHRQTVVKAASATDIPLGDFCAAVCDAEMHCGEHRCKLPCMPKHKHGLCEEEVTFTHACGEHQGVKACHVDPRTLQCGTEVDIEFSRCGHKARKPCHVDPETCRCRLPCEKTLGCGHVCAGTCWDACTTQCQERVEFTHRCGAHQDTRPCYVSQDSLRCEAEVDVRFPDCGHVTRRPCHVDPGSLRCQERCERKLPCGHLCTRACSEPCTEVCQERVRFKHTCADQHDDTRRCHQDPLTLRCVAMVTVRLPDCGHTLQKPCHQDAALLQCLELCERRLACGHACQRLCCETCTGQCMETVTFRHGDCGHENRRLCHQQDGDVKCRAQCGRTLPCKHACQRLCSEPCTPLCVQTVRYTPQSCTHERTRKCHEDETQMKCQARCELDLPCGHRCTQPCWFPCTDPAQRPPCEVWVDFQHSCKKRHSGRKKCFQDGDKIPCRALVDFKFPCRHRGRRECCRRAEEYRCEAPCARMLPCGTNHSCVQRCWEPCDAGRCGVCRLRRQIEESERRTRERRAREAARRRAGAELERYRRACRGREDLCDVRTLSAEGDDAQEYYKVTDCLRHYAQARWVASVTRVERVSNSRLKLRWLETKTALQSPEEPRLLFHHTDAVDAVVREGFPTERGKKAMYSTGLHFTTREANPPPGEEADPPRRLLLCEVLLGRSQTVTSPQPHMDLSILRRDGYDSMYIRRGPAGPQDQFVVYDPRQAYPKYVVHYTLTSVASLVPLPKTVSDGELTMTTLRPARGVDVTDPLQMQYRIAESQFLRLKSNGFRGRITKVDFYENPRLVEQFYAVKTQFKEKYGGSEAAEAGEPILAFHGTAVNNIPNIMKENFRMDKIKRSLHGKGIYFSEFPDVSESYADGTGCLLLCYVLPGRSYEGAGSNSGLKAGYDSHIVSPDKEGRGQMIVIFNPAQILPTYVIHYT